MSHSTSFQDPLKSLFQSAVRHVLRKQGEVSRGVAGDHPMMQAANGVLHDDTTRSAASSASKIDVCAHLYWEKFKAEWHGDTQRVAEIDNEIDDSPCDPRWAEVPLVWGKYYAEHTNPQYKTYGELTDYVYPLPSPAGNNSLTVGVLGDWGTGEDVAKTVLDELMGHRPDVIIHVGDVYYAGTKDQYEDNFLKLVDGISVPIYSLPGNHDYYSGGQAYYETFLPGLRQSPQEASFFCLRNDHWQLQGMDTGYNDHNFLKVDQDITCLRDDEAAWHQHQLDHAGQRQVILFSHHQLLSAFENIGKPDTDPPTAVPENYNQFLYETFKSYLPNITAWFWGHEHLLEIYAASAAGLGLERGRCIGHSAFPMLVESDPYRLEDPTKRFPPKLVLKDSNDPNSFEGRLGVSEEVYNHGYVILDLPNRPNSDNPGTASYYQTPGDGSSSSSPLIWRERLTRDGDAS